MRRVVTLTIGKFCMRILPARYDCALGIDTFCMWQSTRAASFPSLSRPIFHYF
jgi:hypothetical protein